MRVVFMGTPEFAVPSLVAMAREGHDIIRVITRPDRPRGRGQEVAASPVKLAADRLGLRVFQPQHLNAPDVVEELERERPDVLVVVAFGAILRSPLLALPQVAALNVHPWARLSTRGTSFCRRRFRSCRRRPRESCVIEWLNRRQSSCAEAFASWRRGARRACRRIPLRRRTRPSSRERTA